MPRQALTKLTNWFLVVILIAAVLLPVPKAQALPQITARTLALNNSAGAATGVTYTFTFTVPSATVLKSFQAQICTTATGSCTTPSGWTGASADLASQPSNYGDATGWSDESTSSALRFKKTANSAGPTSSQTVVFNGVTNPTANNTNFFARITTYSDDAYTTGVDAGTVAASTAYQIQVSASVNETLTFCTGTSITGQNCGSVSGTSVDLGSLSNNCTQSNPSISVMAASTNAGSGYAITVSGSTLISGGNNIDALSTASTCTTDTEQFGINVRDNATPNIGADPSGATSGISYGSGYGTADTYRFVSGATLVSKTAASNGTTYTVSYMANVDATTAAGTYSGTYTYICTATF